MNKITPVKQDKTPQRRCLFVNTYYPAFLDSHYAGNPGLSAQSYGNQKKSLLSTFFGDSDFYSSALRKQGWEADDIIVNCEPLQKAWVRENGAIAEGLIIAVEQIGRMRPDVVYLQDLGLATGEFVSAIRPFVKLVVGQIASPVPVQAHLNLLDIVFSSFPHFVKRIRSQGVCSYYQPLAFDERVLGHGPTIRRDLGVTFIGGISPSHEKGFKLLEYLASTTPVEFWGYGASMLLEGSPMRLRHHGEAWGKTMFSLLKRSRITVNRHIDVAENYANNMRLFEATGCGALLITDYKDNLADLFEIGKEIVAYRSPEECAALIKYYCTRPDEANDIARAGQKRTLRDHSYARRMAQTGEVLDRHIRYTMEKRTYVGIDISHVSTGHVKIDKKDITGAMLSAWQSETIPINQRALVQQQLELLYKGRVNTLFSVLADMVLPCIAYDSSILEIGCSSAYYGEILEYLLSRNIDYYGLDYSMPLLSLARSYYPAARLCAANGAQLPFTDKSFNTVISSGILLHVPDYAVHVSETVRVARSFVIAHRTPICRKRPTQYLKKRAYGEETCELIFNENEVLTLFESNGLTLTDKNEYSASPENDLFEATYLFKLRNKKTDAPIKTQEFSSSQPESIKTNAVSGPARFVQTKFRKGPVVLVSRDIAFTFPLSYAYLAGYLKAMGEDVVVLFKDCDRALLVKRIMELNPVLVGFGNLYPELKETADLVRMLDQAAREFPIVIGGQMVSPTPAFAVEITGADIGVIGEGEITLHKIVIALRSGEDPSGISGIALRQDGGIRVNPNGEFIADLDMLPPVPYELFPVEKWLEIGKWYAKNCPCPHWKIEDRVINVHGGRGCPYTCNFCYHHSRPRYRSMPVMFAEAAAALERFDGNMLYFSDDLVLASPRRAGQLVTEIRKLSRRINYSVSTRFDNLARMDDELLGAMKETGCRIMGLGVESGSDRILKIIGKNTTADVILTQLERLKKFGILPTVSIMVGQHTETVEDVEASIRLMKQSVLTDPLIQYAFTIMTPFPGSSLYDLIFKNNLLENDREFYNRYFSSTGEWKQIVNLSAMTDQQVLIMYQKIQREYLQVKQIDLQRGQ
jgi:radical SAM superfamily enzyme YgiQ (UPF0313 family)/2-polyprenyl-3-methyl-5-hydroxy-6-metoxy-1,4-benzoquinol methylase